MGKGEIACYETRKNQGLFGKGLTLNKAALENTLGKGENNGNQHFLLFPQCFILDQRE